MQEKVRALEEARKKLREAKEAIEQDGSADEHDVKQEVKDGEDVSDLAGHTKQQHEQKDRPRRPKPKFLECPLCDEYKGNSDPSILRMHIFKHYLDRWNAKVRAFVHLDGFNLALVVGLLAYLIVLFLEEYIDVFIDF